MADYQERFLNKMARTTLLSASRERYWLRQYANGDEQQKEQAMEVLLKHNTRLVLSIVNNFHTKHLEKGDLFNIGMLGLMKAIEEFDLKKGKRLSTYATWWIRQALQRTIGDQERIVRLPIHLGEKLRQVHQVETTLAIELGHQPTEAELSQKLQEIPQLRDFALELRGLPTAQPTLSSLDSTIKDSTSDNDDFYAVLKNEKAEDPVVAILRKSQAQELEAFIDANVSKRHSRVLKMLYGLNGTPAMTLQEASEELGMPVEAVRGIKSKARAKLKAKLERNPKKWRELTEPID